MATREELMAALRAADAAGDTAAAEAIARRIQSVSAAPAAGEGAARTRGLPTPGAAASEGSSAPFERAGGYGPTMAGVAEFGIESALGLKQLFGGLSDEDKAVLAQIKQEREADPNSGWRTAGKIGAGVAALAVPGAKMDKALQGARILSQAGRALPAISAGATGAATEFLTSVGEGDTFGEQLASKGKNAAAAGATGMALAGSLSALAKPFRSSKEAKELMDAGITPTLQQGADSKFGRFVGGMSGGAGEQMVKERQNREVVEAVLARITPGVDYGGKTTSEMVGIMDDVLKGQYDNILNNKIYNLSPTARQEIWKAARTAAGREPDVLTQVNAGLADAGQALRSNNNVRLSADSMKSQRRMLQDSIDAYAADPAAKSEFTRRGLVAARQKFDEVVRNPSLSADELARIADIDSRYGDSRRVMEAAKNPSAQQQMKVADLLRAYRKLDGTGGTAFAKADNPIQRELLEPAARVMNLGGQEDTRAGIAAVKRMFAPFAAGGTVLGGATLGGPMVGVPLAAGYGTSLLGQTKQGARMLFGETAAQQRMADLLRRGVVAPAAPALIQE